MSAVYAKHAKRGWDSGYAIPKELQASVMPRFGAPPVCTVVELARLAPFDT
jgi:hypothetical protein